jgi:hypothetical protein
MSVLIRDYYEISHAMRHVVGECRKTLGKTALPRYLYGAAGTLSSAGATWYGYKVVSSLFHHAFYTACSEFFRPCVPMYKVNYDVWDNCMTKMHERHLYCLRGTWPNTEAATSSLQFAALASVATVTLGTLAIISMRRAWTRPVRYHIV